MKTAILYFSATGNTFYIAKKLSEHIEGDIFYIPHLNTKCLEVYEKIVLISPIYAFGLPELVKIFIENLKGFSDKKFFCILNYGGFSANASYYIQELFLKNNLQIENVFKMKMPVNFTIFFNATQFYINGLLKKSDKAIFKIANLILNNESKRIRKNIFYFLVKFHQKSSTKLKDLSKGFSITNSCNKCGYCEKICPAKNIEIVDGRHIFGANCIACLACYNRCPKMAIAYGKKTNNKKRYKNPNIDFEQMQ